jgi:DNA-binding NtrC family response regulator
MIRVLIVEDESYVAESLVALLGRRGFDPFAVASAEAALDQPIADIVVTDLRLPGRSGFELLCDLKEREPSLPVILLTGQGTVADAVEAMRAGADDFLTKPVEPDVIVERIRKAAARRGIERERDRWRGDESVVGESPAMKSMLKQIEALAKQDVSVLLMGESGTGKELLATHLHERSSRRSGPLVRVHCGAVPVGLVESEFFGHVRGAFSGATQDRRGWFAEADGGTLFLDEIGTLPLESQAKLLRVLETGEMRPVGSNFARRVDVRVVAATNEDLVAMRDAGSFRSDLYYRLAGAPLTIPPLRNRAEDLAPLATRFALPSKITHAALNLLRRYRWPGNVRELRNVIARARVEADSLTRGAALDAADFEPLLPVASSDIHLKTRVAIFERDLFAEALRRADGRKSDAAKLLGIDPSNWAYHAKRLDLQKRLR